MSKLLLLQGLPASGKSTTCKDLLSVYSNAIRINRDLLREMLHCNVWSGTKEDTTRDVAKMVAQYLLERGRMVIIDDTNLAPQVVANWRLLAEESGSSFTIITMETPLEVCLERDKHRENAVGSQVIYGMAMQYGLYTPPAAGIVICDLDGTLANIDHRLHFVADQPKDWAGFFGAISEDSLNTDVANNVSACIGDGTHLFYVSGRSEQCRAVTEQWLFRHYMDQHQALFMRRDGDHRPDTVVKQEILDRCFPQPLRSQIQMVFDDRPSVIRMWREAGLPVTDCGKGVEF